MIFHLKNIWTNFHNPIRFPILFVIPTSKQDDLSRKFWCFPHRLHTVYACRCYETRILFIAKNQFFILLVTSCSHVYSTTPEYNLFVYKSLTFTFILQSVTLAQTTFSFWFPIGVCYSFVFVSSGFNILLEKIDCAPVSLSVMNYCFNEKATCRDSSQYHNVLIEFEMPFSRHYGVCFGCPRVKFSLSLSLSLKMSPPSFSRMRAMCRRVIEPVLFSVIISRETHFH